MGRGDVGRSPSQSNQASKPLNFQASSGEATCPIRPICPFRHVADVPAGTGGVSPCLGVGQRPTPPNQRISESTKSFVASVISKHSGSPAGGSRPLNLQQICGICGSSGGLRQRDRTSRTHKTHRTKAETAFRRPRLSPRRGVLFSVFCSLFSGARQRPFRSPFSRSGWRLGATHSLYNGLAV